MHEGSTGCSCCRGLNDDFDIVNSMLEKVDKIVRERIFLVCLSKKFYGV